MARTFFSWAGPDCYAKDLPKERLQALQNKIIHGYRFDITEPPVYPENGTEYQNVKYGENCDGEPILLVTDNKGERLF